MGNANCCSSNNIEDIKSYHSNVVQSRNHEEVENISGDDEDAYSNAPNEELILKDKSNMDIERT
jgi:hypothetical protein